MNRKEIDELFEVLFPREIITNREAVSIPEQDQIDASWSKVQPLLNPTDYPKESLSI